MHPNCVAIGEAGLDKLIGSSFEIQRKTFIEQALLAEELKLPLIIHCVKAWNELREIKRKLKPNIPWIYHGFNKTSLVDEVIEEGFYLSFGHSLLTNVSLQKRIDNVPLDRIFLETDNANVDLKLLYQCLAEIKDLTLPELEKAIEINVLNIFPKWRIGLAELNY
jgi:TatD DNase family protein